MLCVNSQALLVTNRTNYLFNDKRHTITHNQFVINYAKLHNLIVHHKTWMGKSGPEMLVYLAS